MPASEKNVRDMARAIPRRLRVPGTQEHQKKGAQAQDQEQHNRIDSIEESERGQEAGARFLR